MKTQKVSRQRSPAAISGIVLKGFKSFADEELLEIRPLTLLAGANSSGKSSALQPLLLLKQTLEATYDPGPLLLDGPHVKFSAASQLLTTLGGRDASEEWEIGVEVGEGFRLTNVFRRRPDEKFDLVCTSYGAIDIQLGMTSRELENVVPILRKFRESAPVEISWFVVRNRCFLEIAAEGEEVYYLSGSLFPPLTAVLDSTLRSLIHVPGLRGNLSRSYPTTAVEEHFPGTFEKYTASVIANWQESGSNALARLNKTLGRLGLTHKITARSIDATQVELLVGRMPTTKHATGNDLVNIADVGFGVSQVLPVLVALLVARADQMVYIEQPELHLHPRAQGELAGVLADAVKRDVRVVVETHSDHLLLALQSLVAQGKLAPEKVKLHWFTRDSRGATKVDSADIDQLGAYGEWPEDFGDVRAAVENRYLDAVEVRALEPRKHAKSKK
ncbi:MAG TPA: AAA family ATPase [Thermoanaerobaculia bacterium]